MFVKDRATGQITRVTVPIDGTVTNGPSYRPAISADARHLAFTSSATNLVPGDTRIPGTTPRVFIHDRITGTTRGMTIPSEGSRSYSGSVNPSISSRWSLLR